MIRITGGSMRGRVLDGPVPAGVRPTSGRTREALFSMIGQDLSGQSMIDLFGGSGLMAIEAISRGAGPVRIVERDRRAAALIRQRLAALGVGAETAKVIEGDALTLRLEPADLVFADPPYADDPGRWLPVAAARCSRVLVAEAREGAAWPETVGALTLDRVRVYGDTALAIYRP